MVNQTGLQNSKRSYPLPWWHIPDDISKAIPLKEAAKQMGYHRETIIYKIKNGRLKGFKIDSRWYVVVPQSETKVR